MYGMTLPSRHKQFESPSGMEPKALLFVHGNSPHSFFLRMNGEETLVSLNPECQGGR